MRYKLSRLYKLSKYSLNEGAPNGRCDRTPDHPKEIKLHLEKMPLNGDYDQGGAYWGGTSVPMWIAWGKAVTEKGTVEIFERGINREEAKQRIQEIYPWVRFYR
jgi:hypothetical protein